MPGSVKLGKYLDDQNIPRQIEGVALVDAAGEIIGTPASSLVIKTYTPGGLAVVSGQLTRPADTNAYVQYDLIANSTTAATASSIMDAVRNTGEALRIEVVSLHTSNEAAKGKTFRVHLFSSQPTLTVNDNGVFNAGGAQTLAISGVGGYVGYVDVLLAQAGATGAVGNAAFSIPRTVKPSSANNIYFVLEQRDAAGYTPLSSEVLTVTIEGQWS
ncbi:hypothetical protein HOS13_gp47 [Caulobacter phage Lullwater]|uniref:Uncharacterized protein n=1 Tax=Caulobacter phage Lullwater TaxID=2024607 RepID=A0A291LB52_9CAUD|nr:hypothetical protein HOS13_gp47 [Caulobacter phage Lullwater]ATI16354.1 hypothetical protein Lull_047 [Caulobacter phage Lullwater]